MTPPASKPEPAEGQKWGLWVYDDGLYEQFTIDRIEYSIVHGTTKDGSPCVVGLSRLRAEGDLLKDDWSLA